MPALAQQGILGTVHGQHGQEEVIDMVHRLLIAIVQVRVYFSYTFIPRQINDAWEAAVFIVELYGVKPKIISDQPDYSPFAKYVHKAISLAITVMLVRQEFAREGKVSASASPGRNVGSLTAMPADKRRILQIVVDRRYRNTCMLFASFKSLCAIC